MLKVGIVIPFYGGNSYINRLLSSLLVVSEKYNVQVYIIDNSQPYEKLDADCCPKDVDFKVIEAVAGIGYGRACNIGYQHFKSDGCDVIVVVNQDGRFAPNSLDLMLTTLLQQEDYSVAVPLLTKYESDEVEWFFTHVYLTPMESLVSDLFRGTVQPFYPIQQLCGACFALKLKDYQGFDYLFDELFHMYFEDADLYKRLEHFNKKVMLVPGAVFHHTHGNTTNYDSESIKGLVNRRTSKHIYSLKHNKHNLFSALPGWFLLLFRNSIVNVVSLRFQELLIEMWSAASVVFKLHKIYRVMQAERLALREVK